MLIAFGFLGRLRKILLYLVIGDTWDLKCGMELGRVVGDLGTKLTFCTVSGGRLLGLSLKT